MFATLALGTAAAPRAAAAGGSHGAGSDLTRRLLTQHAEYKRERDAKAQAEALKALEATAAARQRQLSDLIAEHPDLVLQQALPAATRASMPVPIQGLIETEESVDGDLEVLHEDGYQGSRYRYFLQRHADRLELHFAASAPELETGDRVRVKGVRVKEAMAVDSGVASLVVLAAALPNTFGEQSTLVILVNFQDKPTQTWVTPAQAKAIVFGPDATAVSNFYKEASYQQAWLTGDVVGVYTIAVNSSNCDTTSIASKARTAAQNGGANLANYRRLVYAFPDNSGCGWWGLGSVGGNPSQAWINGSFQNGVVSHEMGHNFGLYHSHALDCGAQPIAASCTSIEYGDTLDTMGSAVPPKHFNAAQKERLGWLNYGTSPPITTVQTTGVYTIDPLESMGTGPKALKVKTPDGDWYYIEYRQAIGFDTSTVQNNTNVKTGVVVHFWQQQSPNSIYLLDMTGTASWNDPALTVSNTFTDPASSISISPVWADATAGVNISVGAGGPACVSRNPAVTLQPASQQGQAGGVLTYTVSVTNKDTACATATFAAAAALPSGWTATFTPPSLSLASGASGAISMKVTSSMDATGSNVIPATVSNTADGTLKASAPATYVVQTPSGTPGSFSDSFDRPDAAALGNGWTPVSGSLSIKGNQAATSTARSTHMAVQSSISGATQSASARFAWGNNQVPARFAVVARYKDAKNYLLCYRQASPGSVGVSRVVNGVETILKSTSVVNPVQGQFFALGCQAEGASVTVTLNGQNRATATNAAVVSGKTGIAVTYPAGNRRTAGAVHRIDDFAATAQ